MGKYEPLAKHLDKVADDAWDARFSEIEEILGFSLPASARKHPAWWSNSRDSAHSQSQAWVNCGWETRDIDLQQNSVRFQRMRETRRLKRTREHDELWQEAMAFTGITDLVELERAAARALMRQYAAEQLIKMGGTMPHFKAAPRERVTP